MARKKFAVKRRSHSNDITFAAEYPDPTGGEPWVIASARVDKPHAPSRGVELPARVGMSVVQRPADACPATRDEIVEAHIAVLQAAHKEKIEKYGRD